MLAFVQKQDMHKKRTKKQLMEIIEQLETCKMTDMIDFEDQDAKELVVIHFMVIEYNQGKLDKIVYCSFDLNSISNKDSELFSTS